MLAYQYGAGLCELVTPTNGALMAMLAAAGVGYDDWLKAFAKLVGGLALIGVAAIILCHRHFTLGSSRISLAITWRSSHEH